MLMINLELRRHRDAIMVAVWKSRQSTDRVIVGVLSSPSVRAVVVGLHDFIFVSMADCLFHVLGVCIG